MEKNLQRYISRIQKLEVFANLAKFVLPAKFDLLIKYVDHIEYYNILTPK
jgi:hypothetical protein